MFSKTCQYAFRTTTVIAVASAMGERLSLDAIAERTDSPKAFTAKVLQQLTRAGIMESHKGPSGGFDLPPLMAKKIKLSHIVKAIDDDTVYRGCGMGLKACNASKPCPASRPLRKDPGGLAQHVGEHHHPLPHRRTRTGFNLPQAMRSSTCFRHVHPLSFSPGNVFHA
jgi:Rrf2 family iron-sulfur cluster assembly transcriptional regulator